jgi:hypothetical protein
VTIGNSTRISLPAIGDLTGAAARAHAANPQEVSLLPLDLTLLATMPAGIAVGALVGALAHTHVPGGLLGGAAIGAAVGAATGGALVGIDRLTNGAVNRFVPPTVRDRLHQARFVLRHPTEPWLGPVVLRAANDARAVQQALYGHADVPDGGLDAFRHTFGSALLVLRLQRDHGLSQQRAGQLMTEAGEAYEADGADNDAWSHTMDLANNAAGIAIGGTARDASGAWISEETLRDRVLDAMSHGQVVVIDRTVGATPRLRPTGTGDLPPHM